MSTISSLTSSTSDYWQMIYGGSQSKAAGRKDDLASQLFGDLDTDGSGGISLEESGLDEEIYAGLDADQDGTVTLAELGNALELQRAAFMTQMAQAGQAGSQPPPPPSGDGMGKPNAQDLLASIFGGQTSTEDSDTDSLGDYIKVSTDNDDMFWSAFAGSAEETTAAESSEKASASASASGAGGDSEEEHDEMDLNKDGIVSPEEYAIAAARREAMMNPGGSGETGGTGQRAKAANAYGAFFGTGTSGARELSVTA